MHKRRRRTSRNKPTAGGWIFATAGEGRLASAVPPVVFATAGEGALASANPATAGERL